MVSGTHTIPVRIPKDMGNSMGPAYHKGFPMSLGVPETPTDICHCRITSDLYMHIYKITWCMFQPAISDDQVKSLRCCGGITPVSWHQVRQVSVVLKFQKLNDSTRGIFFNSSQPSSLG